MQQDQITRETRELGLRPDEIGLLPLLPAVYVGWAAGGLDGIQRERLLRIADQVCVSDAKNRDAVEQWLLWPPTADYYRAAMNLFRRLANAPDVLELDGADMHIALAHAETMMRTHRGSMDRITTGNPRQERALAETSWLLGIDHGMPWSALLRELEPSAGEPAAAPAAE